MATNFTRVDIDTQEDSSRSFITQAINYGSHGEFMATAADPADASVSSPLRDVISFMCLCEVALGYGYASEHSYIVRSSYTPKVAEVPAEIPSRTRLIREVDASNLVTIKSVKVPYKEYADTIFGLDSCQMSDISLLNAAQIILQADKEAPNTINEDIYNITEAQLRDAQTYVRGYASAWIKAVNRLKASLGEHISDMITPTYSLKVTDSQTIPLEDVFDLPGFPSVRIGEESKFADEVSDFIATSYPGSTLIIASAGNGVSWEQFFTRYPTLLRLLSASFITEG